MRFLALVLLTASVLHVSAQAPQAFSFQAVATTAGGAAIADASIGVRISLRSGATDGPVVYRETHTTTTSPRGLFTLAIGRGSVVSGTFASIAWGANRHFVEIEIDPAGGSSYTTLGVQELLSVPYALYAGNLATDAATGAIVGYFLNGGFPTVTQFAQTQVKAYQNNVLKGSATIDQGGRFKITDLATGNYVLEVSNPLFDNLYFSVNHQAPGTTSANAFMPEYFPLRPKPTGQVTNLSANYVEVTNGGSGDGRYIRTSATSSNPLEDVMFIISDNNEPSPTNAIDYTYNRSFNGGPTEGGFLIENPFGSGVRLMSGFTYYIRAIPVTSADTEEFYLDGNSGELRIIGIFNLAGASNVVPVTIP